MRMLAWPVSGAAKRFERKPNNDLVAVNTCICTIYICFPGYFRKKYGLGTGAASQDPVFWPRRQRVYWVQTAARIHTRSKQCAGGAAEARGRGAASTIALPPGWREGLAGGAFSSDLASLEHHN